MSKIVDAIQRKMNEKYCTDIELVLVSWRGSMVYGTNMENSDQDIQVIYFPPADHILGLQQAKGKDFILTVDQQDYDVAIQPILKFCQLARNANPNVIECLFLREYDYLYLSDVGERLLQLRYAFVSKKLKHSLGGFAYSQLKRLNTLNKDATQNSERMRNIEKYGIDLKKAYNCIRLLNMGIEVLQEGELYVFRSDREMLKNIRRGLYSHEEIVEMAERKMDLLDESYIHSDIQHSPDDEKINAFLLKELFVYLKQDKIIQELLEQ